MVKGRIGLEQLQRPFIFRRLGAFFIDHCIISFVVVAALFMFTDFEAQEAPHVAVSLSACMAGAFVLFLCKDIIGGRSVGKRMFGIGVKDDSFHVPPMGKLIVRNMFTFLWIIELLLIVGSGSKKKLGDRLTQTDVYVVKPNRGVVGIIVSVLMTMILFAGVLFLGVIQLMKQSEAYTAATAHIKEDAKIISIAGDNFTFGFAPTGQIQLTNGYGSSELRIKVKGSKSTVVVHTTLKKTPGSSWIVEDSRILD